MANVGPERILASVGCAAFTTNAGGQVLDLNAPAEALFGYAASSIRGRNCWEVFAGRDRFYNCFCLEHCALREMAARGEAANPCELYLRTASGAMLGVNVAIVPLRGSGVGRGAILHLLRTLSRSSEDARRTSEGQKATDRLYLSGLSPREYQVLALLAAGKSCHDIAEKMAISLVTVRNHLKRLFPKLRVHSQAEAVSFAFRNNLV